MLELALEAKSGRLVQVVELHGIETDIHINLVHEFNLKNILQYS